MNYTIGFMDKYGEYSDMREFTDVKITPDTKIDTVAAVDDETYMYVDENSIKNLGRIKKPRKKQVC